MLVQTKPSLVVVGNYHLLGPDGVLAQLRQQELAAKRIYPTAATAPLDAL